MAASGSDLYVGGVFGIAGGKVSGSIALARTGLLRLFDDGFE
jgi:hypothetical protein